MSMTISGSGTNAAITRMQTAFAAARVAEQARKKGEGEDPTIDRTAIKTGDDKPRSPMVNRAASSDGPRVEVDRRTEDSESVKITVISYSDGSSESVTLMKADEVTAQISNVLARQDDAPSQPSRQTLSITDKGLLVNKFA